MGLYRSHMWFDVLEFPPNFLDYESLMFFVQTIHSFIYKTSLKLQSGANTFLKTHLNSYTKEIQQIIS